MFHILILSNNKLLQRQLQNVLKPNGFSFSYALHGTQAFALLEQEHFNLAMIDSALPGSEAYQLIEQLKNFSGRLPILVLSPADDFPSKKKAILLGADDFINIPPEPQDLLLRIQALLCRFHSAHTRHLQIGNTILDYDTLTLTCCNTSMLLPQKEFCLLFMLASCPGQIFTRQQLMDEIWGPASCSESRTVDVHVNRLRERLKKNSDIRILTIRGIGYCMEKCI